MNIKKYLQFISEELEANQLDKPEMASEINSMNSKQKQVQEFNRHKVDIQNIYKTYSNEGDLINKLFARGFIIKKTTNKKEMNFKNELLRIWAQSCEKRRELDDIKKNIEKLEKDNKDRDYNIRNNPGVSNSESQAIELNTKQLKSYKDQVIKLQNDVLRLEKEATTKLNTWKQDLVKSKNKVFDYRLSQKSYPADTTQ